MATRSVTLRLPEETVRQAADLAKSQGLSFNRYSEQLFSQALRAAENQKLKADFDDIAGDYVDDDEAWTRLGRETLDNG